MSFGRKNTQKGENQNKSAIHNTLQLTNLYPLPAGTFGPMIHRSSSSQVGDISISWRVSIFNHFLGLMICFFRNILSTAILPAVRKRCWYMGEVILGMLLVHFLYIMSYLVPFDHLTMFFFARNNTNNTETCSLPTQLLKIQLCPLLCTSAAMVNR